MLVFWGQVRGRSAGHRINEEVFSLKASKSFTTESGGTPALNYCSPVEFERKACET